MADTRISAAPAPSILSARFISLRDSVTGATVEFLEREKMSCLATQTGLVGLIVALSNYHEEGRPLFPELCLMDDLEQSLGLLSAVEHLRIGTGPRSPETMERALKECALLAVASWSIYIVRRPDAFEFGVFRSDGSELGASLADRVLDVEDAAIPLVIVHQIAPNRVELRGIRRNSMVISFEAGLESPAALAVLQAAFIPKLCSSIDPALREQSQTFYTNLISSVLKAGHGTLAAVLEAGIEELPACFFDGVALQEPFSVTKRIAELQQSKSIGAGEAIRAATSLISGMLLSDGITLFRPDGSVLAYRVFVKHPPADAAGPTPVGGARRRTFEVLRGMLRQELEAVFMQSQDGQVECIAREEIK
jgi:hypothetical protein